MSEPAHIAVLGAGAWGTALAQTMLHAGHEVRLWGRDAEAVASINERHENPGYLPGIGLHPALKATLRLDEAVGNADIVLMAIPAQSLRALLSMPGIGVIRAKAPIVLCAKGIERETGQLLSALVSGVLPGNPVAALSGPSFATDVAHGLPTAVTIAAADGALAARLAARLSAPHLRCYSSDDLVGVEVGGALKNVLAIAAGAAAGADLGASAQAALVTRGFVELRRVGQALGARAETLMGLSGLGDLILTCGSAKSRNFSYGQALGRGESLDNMPLAEGVATAAIAARIARERGVDAPIIDAVDRMLKNELTIDRAVAQLLARPLKAETG